VPCENQKRKASLGTAVPVYIPQVSSFFL